MDNYGEITKPTINMLPMKEIKEEILRGFRQENKIELEKMAVVYDGNISQIDERDTVKNTKLLDGKESTDYVLQSQIEQYDNNAANDLLTLRTELYELKNELIKNDTIAHSNLYSGFQDPMKKNHILYDTSRIENNKIVEQSSDNKSILFNKTLNEIDNRLNTNDYVSLHLANKENVADKIEDIEGKRLTLENKNMTKRDIRYISNNSGEYNNGYYCFAETDIDSSSGETKVSGFNDGRNKSIIKLENNKIGLLHTFFVNSPINSVNKSVNSSSMWILKKALINAIPKTDSGHLECYIIKADDYNSVSEIDKHDLSLLDDSDIKFIAKSKPAYASQYMEGLEQEIIFDFTDKDIEIIPNCVYGMLIMHVNNSAENTFDTYWDITTSYYKDLDEVIDDEHKSNELYLCESTSDETIQLNKQTNMDLQYQVFLEEKTHVEFMPHTNGVYTAYFNSDLNNSKALLSMQIKKEGINYFGYNGISLYPKGSQLLIKNSNDYNMHIANKGDTIIINNNARKILETTFSDNIHYITLTDDIFIDKPVNTNKIPVYRMGYKVFLTGYFKDNTTQSLNYINSVELALSKVIPDMFDNVNRSYSDRLIFETPNNSEDFLSKCNYFKIQIVWDGVTDDVSELMKYKDFTGAIRDINLSLVDNKFIDK